MSTEDCNVNRPQNDPNPTSCNCQGDINRAVVDSRTSTSSQGGNIKKEHNPMRKAKEEEGEGEIREALKEE